MKYIRIEKVTLNLGVGGPGEKMEKALKLLKNLTGKTPVQTATKKRIPGWSIRPGLKIGCKVTLRKKQAEDFFKKMIEARNNTLKPGNFDANGNLSFGIPEYLDIPGAEYDMSIGIIGFEAAVTLCRPGFRLKRRRIRPGKIPKVHRISKEQAMGFITTKYGVNLSEEAE